MGTVDWQPEPPAQQVPPPHPVEVAIEEITRTLRRMAPGDRALVERHKPGTGHLFTVVTRSFG